MMTKDGSKPGTNKPAEPHFLVEKEGRLYLTVAVADYGKAGAAANGSEELRKMFKQGRRRAPLDAVEIASAGIAAIKPGKPMPGKLPSKSPPPPRPGPPPPAPPPPTSPGPPGVGTEPPGVGTDQ